MGKESAIVANCGAVFLQAWAIYRPQKRSLRAAPASIHPDVRTRSHGAHERQLALNPAAQGFAVAQAGVRSRSSIFFLSSAHAITSASAFSSLRWTGAGKPAGARKAN